MSCNNNSYIFLMRLPIFFHPIEIMWAWEISTAKFLKCKILELSGGGGQGINLLLGGGKDVF